MVNINCLSNCIYQSDGKCTLSKIQPINNININKDNCIDCAYYTNYINKSNK